MRFVNDGSSVLVTGGPGNGLTFVDSSGTPFPFSNSGCYMSSNAAPACRSSTNAMDLAPGDSATWCTVIEIPVGDTLSEVQFNASNLGDDHAFGNGGSYIIAIWNVP